MPDHPDRHAPADFDRPSTARVHDWLLGGTLNTPIDRDAAAPALAALPDLPGIVRRNRAFRNRAVRHLAASGIRQFLDLGAGLPTMTPTHRVAHQHDGDIAVVYVDRDPTTVAHSRHLLDGVARVTAVRADLRRADQVLRHPEARGLLDLDRPVGVLAVDVLDTLTDDDRPGHVLDAYLDAVAPGSALVLTHLATAAGTSEERGTDLLPRVARPPRAIAAWLARLTLVEPGLTAPEAWGAGVPAPAPPHTVVCAVGRLP
ncbi:SAM-dependent methyltransferase [Saccharothrix australiensis]|uniref:S-adenosyl methyltransferase n=1 Tax=Saccharothrix australiensis TaxID=2072 RepID=A0A495W2A2_9PSEU|nr:SAM-dependent methyltransferase [Saccharothrix australiensis]RKT55772.1 S-adenosyl methyltransferase [Saccharothrix australiensis]